MFENVLVSVCVCEWYFNYLLCGIIGKAHILYLHVSVCGILSLFFEQ